MKPPPLLPEVITENLSASSPTRLALAHLSERQLQEALTSNTVQTEEILPHEEKLFIPKLPLFFPVIRDVDELSISGLNKAIAEVSERARIGKLRVDDFGGGTFTVDNTGWLGTNMVMPIINVPEVGIVTMDRITKRPVVVETPDGDVIAIRSIMNMVLGVDHRANDGASGAAFLRDIKAWLEAVGPDTAIF